VKIRTYRRIVEWTIVLLYFLLPFLKIGGQSALRFDVATLRLHFFGTTLWMQEFFFVLLATVFLVALFLFLTLVFGRVWCGWFCPQTVACDLTGFMDRGRKKPTAVRTGGNYLLLALLSLLFGFITICYFISPYEAIPRALQWQLGPVPSIATLVLAVITFLNFAFLRRTFCATICPYAKIQSVLTDDRSLIIQMDPQRKDECIDCTMCVRSCPTGVDIRTGMQVSCIMCAECIDACNQVMGRKNKKGLIVYSFGKKGISGLGALFRPAAIIVVLACLFSFGALVYKTQNRTSFDFNILPHPMEARITKEGDVLNAYILSIKNRRDSELILECTVKSDGTVQFSHNITDALHLEAGTVDKFPLFIRSRGKPDRDMQITIQLTDRDDPLQTTAKTVYFNLP